MNSAARLITLVLLLASASSARPQTEPLGRLFFTPEQRALLDRQRRISQTGPIGDGASITLNGRVSRSSGRNTAWINGVPVDEAEALAQSRIRLHPGQTIRNSNDAGATDLLNGGTITVHGKAARP